MRFFSFPLPVLLQDAYGTMVKHPEQRIFGRDGHIFDLFRVFPSQHRLSNELSFLVSFGQIDTKYEGIRLEAPNVISSFFSFFYCYFLRVTLLASCVMRLENFPLDSQTCYLKFGSCKHLYVLSLWSQTNSSLRHIPKALGKIYANGRIIKCTWYVSF